MKLGNPLKRRISGVYHAVSQKHLQSYLDEYTFKYDYQEDEQTVFKSMLAQIQSVYLGG